MQVRIKNFLQGSFNAVACYPKTCIDVGDLNAEHILYDIIQQISLGKGEIKIIQSCKKFSV